MNRLVDEWKLGINCFDDPGELFVGAFSGSNLAAVGGLNREPYAPQDGRARLRHIYVARDYRGTGVGRQLVTHLLTSAASDWKEVRLRAKTAAAAAFYEVLGFTPLDDPAATHEIRLLQATN